VARNEARRHPLGSEHGACGYRNGKQRWLCVLGQLEVLFRTLKAESRDRKSQGFIGFFEYAARFGDSIGKRLAHAGGLRALAGKEKCSFVRQTVIITSRYEGLGELSGLGNPLSRGRRSIATGVSKFRLAADSHGWAYREFLQAAENADGSCGVDHSGVQFRKEA
jgi:hypothetical protein